MRNKIFLTLILFSTFLIVDAQSYKKGFKKINEQDYIKAEKIFAEALAENNTDAIVNYGLSLIYSNFNYPNYDLFKAFQLINIANKNKEQITVEQLETIKDYFTIDKISIEKERIDKELFKLLQSKNNLDIVNKFLSECQSSIYYTEAIKISNKLEFESAQNTNTIKSFNDFIQFFPDAEQINEAIEIRNKLAFEKAKSSNTIEGFNSFLNNYPEASQFNEIKNLKAELILWKKTELDSSITNIDIYLTNYPKGQYFLQALRLKEDRLWKEILKDTSLTLINKYQIVYPNGKYANEAITLKAISKRLYTLKEIKKYLRNNQIINSFSIDKNGSLNLMLKENLYNLCNDYGDSWCRSVENVSSVSFSPDDINIIYAIKNNGYDIIKSVDAGKSWITIKNGLPNNIRLFSIFINPHNSSEIFITSESGIYKTSDAGFFWKPFKVGIIPYQFSIDASDKNRFYLLSNEGPCISSDAGESWKLIGNTLPKVIAKGAGRSANYRTVNAYNMININHIENSTLLLFTEDGIYKTENDGQNWIEINSGFSKTALVTSVFLSDDEILLGCSEFISALNKYESAIYKSDYTNIKWEKININSNEFQGISGIYKSPLYLGIFIKSNEKIAYIDTSFNVIGLNYGVISHSIIHAFNYSNIDNKKLLYAIVENKNYIDSDNHGLWYSTNNGISWCKGVIYNHYANWASPPLQKIFISPHDPLEIWSIDNNFNYVSFDGGITWYDIKEKYGIDNLSDISFDPSNKNIMYFSTDYLFRFDRTTLGKIQLCKSGPHFVVANDNIKNIVTSNYQVSNDGGWTWNSFYNKLDKLMMVNRFNLNNGKAIPLDYIGNKIIMKIVSTDLITPHGSYLVVSSDNGANWQIYKSFDRLIRSTYINPLNHENMIVIKEEGQYSAFTGLSVLQTSDGSVWESVFNYSIPPKTYSSEWNYYKHYYKDVTIDNDEDKKTIYLNGNAGLLRSFDNGKTLQKIGGIHENK